MPEYIRIVSILIL